MNGVNQGSKWPTAKGQNDPISKGQNDPTYIL